MPGRLREREAKGEPTLGLSLNLREQFVEERKIFSWQSEKGSHPVFELVPPPSPVFTVRDSRFDRFEHRLQTLRKGQGLQERQRRIGFPGLHGPMMSDLIQSPRAPIWVCTPDFLVSEFN